MTGLGTIKRNGREGAVSLQANTRTKKKNDSLTRAKSNPNSIVAYSPRFVEHKAALVVCALRLEPSATMENIAWQGMSPTAKGHGSRVAWRTLTDPVEN